MSGEGGALLESACEVMHDAYEAAAAAEGWETQERSRKPWGDVPEANKATMRSAVRALLASPALADLLAAERQRGREEALREAAKEAEERGDIGKDGGCEAWTWLRIRADRIAETP